VSDEEWIELLAPLETEEDWARLAAAFPNSLLTARWRLYVAWSELKPQLIEACGGERIYGLMLRLAELLQKSTKNIP
jgi:hypothetical protein